MEDIIEVVIENLLEGALDIVDTASTSKRLPVGLRIFAAVMLFLILSGVLGGIIFAGVMVIKNDGSVLLGILMFAIAAFIMGYLVWKFKKILNRRN